MERDLRPPPWRRAAAWIVIGGLLAGFVAPALGMWTGPILAAWFIGTQKPAKGLIWLLTINLGLSLVFDFDHWAPFRPALAGARMAGLLWGLSPFLAYRLFAPRRRCRLAALALPSWGVGLMWGAGFALPPGGQTMGLPSAAEAGVFARMLSGFGPYGALYVSLAVAATVVWIWVNPRRGGWARQGLPFLGVLVLLPLAAPAIGAAAPAAWRSIDPLALACLGLALATMLAAFVERPFDALVPPSAADLALLRSPGGRGGLSLGPGGLHDGDGGVFPIERGVPDFLKPADFDGGNGRLSRLYADLAGLYDDIQRVSSLLDGLDRDAYVRAYLRGLEIRPQDRVLETSIGTGLSFKYLPADIGAYGVDLSKPMLSVCRDNFSRWRKPVHLYAANAEALPFANDTFDCVFHVGGVNFFNDKSAAICEMIRVAKPGTRLLIADETEKHVKTVYEASPGAGRFFSGRDSAVAAPVDLVPDAMEEVSLRTLRNGRFYVLTFRKPLPQAVASADAV